MTEMLGKNKVEHFFLNSLLGISIVGNLLSLIADTLLPSSDNLAIPSDITFAITLGIAYFLRKKFPVIAVLILTSVALITVLYQAYHQPSTTVTSLAMILLVGFVISVMLKGRTMWCMHILTFLSVNTLFLFQFLTPSLRFLLTENDTISLAVTYSILYFILTYASAGSNNFMIKTTMLWWSYTMTYKSATMKL